jgi:hypothetical protein
MCLNNTAAACLNNTAKQQKEREATLRTKRRYGVQQV